MDSTFPSDIRSRPKTSRMHGMTVQMVVMLKMAVPKAAIEVVEDVEWMLMDEPKPLAVLVMQMLATCFVFF